ncbi:MAG: alpha-ribazole phosphatase family protein [Moraxellaceae bacterium]|nr:alpha-ribazole phosphatase family protein [Moraxellaceae bacterium]
MTRILQFVRHPPTVPPVGVCYGRSDVALADDVNAHAERLRPSLHPGTRILSSPLSRCRQLAEAIGPHACDDRLMEIDFGDWELLRFDAIGRDALDTWAADPLHFRPPGGESVSDMSKRVIAALQDALHVGSGPLLIVTHGGPLRASLGHLLTLSAGAWTQLPVPYATLIRLQRDGSSWRRLD